MSKYIIFRLSSKENETCGLFQSKSSIARWSNWNKSFRSWNSGGKNWRELLNLKSLIYLKNSLFNRNLWISNTKIANFPSNYVIFNQFWILFRFKRSFFLSLFFIFKTMIFQRCYNFDIWTYRDNSSRHISNLRRNLREETEYQSDSYQCRFGYP